MKKIFTIYKNLQKWEISSHWLLEEGGKRRQVLPWFSSQRKPTHKTDLHGPPRHCHRHPPRHCHCHRRPPRHRHCPCHRHRKVDIARFTSQNWTLHYSRLVYLPNLQMKCKIRVQSRRTEKVNLDTEIGPNDSCGNERKRQPPKELKTVPAE